MQDAVEDAVEEDPGFGAIIEPLLARLAETRNSAPSFAGFDLRGAKGVQVGNFNKQTNTTIH